MTTKANGQTLHGQTNLGAPATAVTFAGFDSGKIAVTNRGTGDMWARFDGTAAVGGAADNFLVRPDERRVFDRTELPDADAFASLISGAAEDYSVEAW